MRIIDPAELRDLIREYGREVVDAADYQVLYEFGIWFADKVERSDIVLSDWSPLKKEVA